MSRDYTPEELEQHKELLLLDDVPYPAPKGKTWKTDGQSNWILVDDERYFDEEGKYKKYRKKPTNITPKKKKRKR